MYFEAATDHIIYTGDERDTTCASVPVRLHLEEPDEFDKDFDELVFWFDLWVDDCGELDGDWNQYMFYLFDLEDQFRKSIQEEPEAFETAFEAAEEYAFESGIFCYDGDKVVFVGK